MAISMAFRDYIADEIELQFYETLIYNSTTSENAIYAKLIEEITTNLRHLILNGYLEDDSLLNLLSMLETCENYLNRFKEKPIDYKLCA